MKRRLGSEFDAIERISWRPRGLPGWWCMLVSMAFFVMTAYTTDAGGF